MICSPKPSMLGFRAAHCQKSYCCQGYKSDCAYEKECSSLLLREHQELGVLHCRERGPQTEAKVGLIKRKLNVQNIPIGMIFIHGSLSIFMQQRGCGIIIIFFIIIFWGGGETGGFFVCLYLLLFSPLSLLLLLLG